MDDAGAGLWGTRGPLRGALEVEATARGVLPHRLPAAVRAQVSDGFCALAEAQPSGVRLAFRTEATVLELDVVPFPGAVAGDADALAEPADADPAAGVFGPPGGPPRACTTSWWTGA